jgi:hypothetical protein
VGVALVVGDADGPRREAGLGERAGQQPRVPAAAERHEDGTADRLGGLEEALGEGRPGVAAVEVLLDVRPRPRW